MTQTHIAVRGAREQNLKNISIDIPREKLVVITGLSGSGKSSLAFDTIYAEGQRRYVETMQVVGVAITTAKQYILWMITILNGTRLRPFSTSNVTA